MKQKQTYDAIANKFSSFKRDFMSAPIRKAMLMVMNNKDGFEACQIDYRKSESFWVFGSAKDVTVTFQINFEGKDD